MSFRKFNQTYLEPGFQTLMILGIIALCQPWSEVLHRYGLTITLVGLVGFSIAIKIAPDADKDEGNAP
jgi:hypothetical protein